MTAQSFAPVSSASFSPQKMKPLSGLLVVLTQAMADSAQFADLLRGQGATPIFYPCMEIVPPRNSVPLDDAIQHAAAGKFDWLIVPDVNVVDALAQRLAEAGLAASALADVRVAAVGNATTQAVTDQLGLPVTHIDVKHVDARSAASKSGSSGLADALGIQPGQRVLLPQSAQNKAGLSKALTAAGADVTVVTAYRTVPAQEGDDVPTMLWQGKIDVVTFSSPSSIRFFRKRLDMMGGKLGMLQDVVVACMDPATANIARQHGLSVRIMPEKQSVAGLVEALTQYFDSA